MQTPLPNGEGPEPIEPEFKLSHCLCEDKNCEKLKCKNPVYNPPWWLSTKGCALVVDPEFGIKLAGTVYAQARECQSNKAGRVIDIDDDWVIDVHIHLEGPPPYPVCGHWCISACLEDMCGPTYHRFPHDSADSPYCCCLVETDQFTSDYEIRICIPAGIVKESVCGAPYELTVIVTFLSGSLIPGKTDKCDPKSYLPFGVATACELPLMTFYDGG